MLERKRPSLLRRAAPAAAALLGLGGAVAVLAATAPVTPAHWIVPSGPALALSTASGAVSFRGVAGDRVSLLTQPSGTSGQSCLSVAIGAPDGATVLYRHQQCGAPDFSDALTLPATGIYTIAVDPPSGAILSLFSVPPDGSGALIAGAGAATAVIRAPGENASFTFAGTAGEQVSLLIQVDSALHQQCFAVTVTAPDGKTPIYANSQCGPADVSGALRLPVTGSYRVMLDPAGWATGTAQLTLLDASGPEGEVRIPGATRFVAAIPAPGRMAQFSFNGHAGTRVSLLTEADSALRQQCLAVAIVTPDGKTRVYSHSQCGTPDFSEALTLPATGTYALRVAPMGSTIGTATLTLYAVPPDAAGSTAIGGGAAELATMIPGQAMRVSFPGTANATANIAVTADAALSSQCYTVRLIAPDDSVMKSDRGCDTSYASGVQRLPATGLYTISVSSTGDAVGTAAIAVSAQ